MISFVIVNMDASPIQSGSKCGASDFSIERILGDRKDREETVEAPEWLCCTRYRPPRLPRATTVCRSRRAGRHARVPFTAAQAGALEAAYARAPYLAPPALKALAAALQLRDDRIKIWFQNRRARERREKSANIIPPQGVTLTPTTIANQPTWLSQANLNFNRNSPAFKNASVHNSFPQTIQKGSELQNVMRFEVPLCARSDDNSSISSNSREDDEDLPDTPLDIET